MATAPALAALHVAIVMLASACAPDRPAFDYTVIPGDRLGPVTAESTEAGLIDLFGPGSVSRRDIEIGEGFCVPGTVLFAASDDAIEITWTDTTRTEPATASTDVPGSPYVTPRGVRVGSTLQQLEALRGEPVGFTGFGWDYGGRAAWSDDGTDDASGLVLNLTPDSASNERIRDDPRHEEILGEATVYSDHPLIREMTIHVERMTVTWAEPGPQRACN